VSVFRLVLISLGTGCATAIGALPFLLAKNVHRRVYDALLGFGAGLMLAAATLGLLPAALKDVRNADGVVVSHLAEVVFGFLGGVFLLALLDRLIPHLHAGGHHEHLAHGEHAGAHEHCHHQSVDERARHQGLLVVGAMSLHRFPEGFAIGAGFAEKQLHSLGVLLACVVAMQNAIEGMVMAAPLKRGGLRASSLLGIVFVSGLAVPVAAILGFLFSAHITGSLPVALSLAAGALIYLTCSEIIPESHSHGHERGATFGLIAGFLLTLLFQAGIGSA
jgi:ZIP family zinc transporter